MIGVVTAIALATDLTCIGGSALLGLLQPAAWTVRQGFEGYLVTTRATVSLPLTDRLAAAALEGRVLQFHWSHLGAVTILELRIVRTTRDERTGRLEIEARGVEQDLGEEGGPIELLETGRRVRTITDYDQTLTGALAARILPGGPAHIVAGTITPTATLAEITYTRSTRLAAVLAWAAALEELTGERYDVWVERNGTTNYRLCVGDYSAGLPVVDVMYGTNLLGYREVRDRQPLATRVWFDRDDALHWPLYQVSAVNAAWIEVVDLTGGLGPAQEDDEWIGAYWVEQKNGTAHAITDTLVIDAQTTRLYMASTSGITAAERGYLAADSNRSDLGVVDSPARIAAWRLRGVELAGRDPRSNLMPDPRFATPWVGGLPVGWTQTGPGTVTEETSDTYVGGSAVRIAPNTPAVTVLERTLTIHVDRPTTLLLSAWVQLTDPAGDGSVAVATRVGVGAFANVAGSPWAFTGSTYVGGYIRHDFTVPLTTANAHDIRLRLSNDEGAASGHDVLFGALLLVEGTEVLAFFEGSGSARNIAAAHRKFSDDGQPQLSCDVDALDLAALMPRDWGDRPIQLGTTLRVTAPRVGLPGTQLRVIDRTVTSDKPTNPRLVVSTRRDRLTALLAAR